MALCCVKIQQPSNPYLSLLDLCTSSLCLMKLTRQTRSTAYRDQNPGIRPPTAAARVTTRGQQLLELSHASPKILDSQLGSQPHAPPRRTCRPPIYLAWESVDLTNSHAPTRVVGYLSYHHALKLAVTRRRTDADASKWHHHSTLACHAHPRPRHPWPDPKTRNQPGPCINWFWAWTSWFWLFALTFDQKSKFPKGPILLSFSRRFQFQTLFLHLKLQNWSIGTFFIVVSSKAFFEASPSDLFMLIQPQAFIELPPWVWGRVLEIYIKHISLM